MCTDRLSSIGETDFSVESERLIIETGVKKYSLEYLLSRCDASIPRSSRTKHGQLQTPRAENCSEKIQGPLPGGAAVSIVRHYAALS